MKLVSSLSLLVLFACGTPSDEAFSWDAVLNSDHQAFNTVMADLPAYEVQINYTQIDRDAEGNATLTSQEFLVDTMRYFYPASTVKMPTAFVAIHLLNELIADGYDLKRSSIMHHDSVRAPQRPAVRDTSHSSGQPSLAHYINKLFVVSDNDAYNRLYEFCGQKQLNQTLQKLGVFSNSRIRTRVGISGFDTEDNRYGNPVRFLDDNESEVFYQSESYAGDTIAYPYLTGMQKGKGYYDESLDSTIMKPFDMEDKNFINIKDLEASLQRVILPEVFSEDQRFNLSEDDYRFLYRAMSTYPKDFDHLKHQDKYYDGYVKFFMFGDSKEEIPDHIHIFNKVGFAYGTLTDCAYIFDTEMGVEFFLTATILVNDNGIFNDGRYEYDSIGIPFLAELGRLIYEHELTRNREHWADFSIYLD